MKSKTFYRLLYLSSSRVKLPKRQGQLGNKRSKAVCTTLIIRILDAIGTWDEFHEVVSEYTNLDRLQMLIDNFHAHTHAVIKENSTTTQNVSSL